MFLNYTRTFFDIMFQKNLYKLFIVFMNVWFLKITCVYF